MAKHEHRRVLVLDSRFCTAISCPYCLVSLFEQEQHSAECAKPDCDNHMGHPVSENRKGAEVYPPLDPPENPLSPE